MATSKPSPSIRVEFSLFSASCSENLSISANLFISFRVVQCAPQPGRRVSQYRVIL